MILDFSSLGVEKKMVTKWTENRSPGLMLVDLCSVFPAEAVGKGPGPKFGRKPDPNRQKLKSIF